MSTRMTIRIEGEFLMAQPPKFNMNELLKKAQELQKNLEEQKEKLKAETTTISVGGNAVVVTVDGEKNLKSIKIDPDLVADGDVSVIEDLIVSAINSANAEIDKKIESQMSAMAGPALNALPGLGNLFGK